MKKEDRAKFKQRLKQTSVGDWQRYHEKGRPAVMLPPVWRMSISINISPDDLALIPPPTTDFSDKVIMFKTAKAEGLPGPELEEQEQFRQTIQAELPAFIHFLLHDLDSVFPDSLRNRRFGVRSYEHPDVRADMQGSRPEIQLLEMIDTAKPWLKSDKGYWLGKWHELQTILENDGEVSADFERWLKYNPFVPTLSKIKSESEAETDTPGPCKDRVAYVRHGNGGLWKVFPPPAGATQTEPSLDGI